MGMREMVNWTRVLGISDNKTRIKKIALVKPQLKKSNVRGTHHETLQRIADVQDICNHYQQHWFSAGLEVSIVITCSEWC